MTSFWPNVTKVPFCVYSAFSSFLHVVRIDVYFCTLSVQGQRGINRSSSGWCIQLDSTSLTASKAISRKSMSFSGSTLSHIEHCKSALTIRIPGCWQQMTWVEKKIQNDQKEFTVHFHLTFDRGFVWRFWSSFGDFWSSIIGKVNKRFGEVRVISNGISLSFVESLFEITNGSVWFALWQKTTKRNTEKQKEKGRKKLLIL